MKKDRPASSNTSIPDPLNSFARRISEENRLSIKDSKVTARELLTSLMSVHKQLGCLPSINSAEKCKEVKEPSIDFGFADKKIEEAIACACHHTEEELEEEESETPTYTSATDELVLSFDGKWLRSFFKIPLKMAMKEIVAKKPFDPVSYLGFWLLNYRRCQERRQWQLERDNELNYLRSLVEEPEPKEEEVSVCIGEEEEQMRDWNFKHYETTPDNK